MSKAQTTGLAPSCADEPPLFSAYITPNTSLDGRGHSTLLLALLAGTALIGVLTCKLGLWPVSLFAVANGTFLAAALSRNRAALRREQHIGIWPGRIEVHSVRRGAAVSKLTLPTLALVVERLEDPDHGCMKVALRCRHDRHVVAEDLSPAERTEFADALVQALSEAGASFQTIHAALPGYGWRRPDEPRSHPSRLA